MTNKIDDLTKRLKTKQEAHQKAIEARDRQIQKVKDLEIEIKLLEAEFVTAHLVANKMSLSDLSELLGTNKEEDSHVSGD